MSNNLNEDVIMEILEQLWDIHSIGWDSEFRPEASRRFYSNYSLVSKIWTLPSQRYVYRNAYLRWGSDWASFEAGLKNTTRGHVLRESIRVLYLYISHSGMGISVQKLDKILSHCPNLVELRLSTGPEINSLFLKPSQESRLRSYFLSVRPTLRALQVRLDGRCKKSKIIKQMEELVPFSTLDFLSLTSNDGDVWMPPLDPTEWDVRSSGWTSIQWPLETNAHTIPLRGVLPTPPQEGEKGEGLPKLAPIYPHTLRFNSTEVYPWYAAHPFLELLGSRLKHVMCQTMFDQAQWNKDCEMILAACPNLEQLIIFDCHKYRLPKHIAAPRLYVLEPQDWHITVEEEGPAEPSGEEAASREKTPASRTRILAYGDAVSTASHMVSFVERVSNTWLKEKNTLEFRKEPIFDPRWLQEAFTGQPEPRSAGDMKHTYASSWSDTLIERHTQYKIALRRPSTLPTSDTES
jgi:hypothetical protein